MTYKTDFFGECVNNTLFDMMFMPPTKAKSDTPVDTFYLDDKLCYHIALPGIKKEYIEIEIDPVNRLISVKGKIKQAAKYDKIQYIKEEIDKSKINITINIPIEFDIERDPDVYCKNGILEIILHKSSEMKNRKVDIK